MVHKAKSTDKHNHSSFRQTLACLKSSSLFYNIPEKEISIFSSAAQLRSFTKGKIIYLEGEVAKYFYVICSGWIKIFHILPEGTEVVVDMLTVSQPAGISALFEQGLHTSNAQVAEDVQLLCIPINLLEEQIRPSSKLALSMLASLSRMHRRRCTEIALNSARRAPQRVGSFLLRLCPENKKKGITFDLPYDKTLIASTLGMTRGSFSRALNTLRDKASIRINGISVEIDSVDKLAKFVYGQYGMMYKSE
jgi:CRP-like cAMP-binding protein